MQRSLTDRFPGAKLIRVTGNTRVWRQRPIAHMFANHRTVADVDAGQLVSGRNAIFNPVGSQPQDGAEGCSDSSALGANVFNHVHSEA
ncbi:hypothetical protein [Sphingobium yanoikuyae]|uniref:Uncharacterized protein n=1 Tax=Sphingobium yanoikuyae TaxID=13690 RepID=A0A0J9D3R7_SPHYA|nr:hypothetical protein [Sphingobium yanoikuyae]ATP19775.1 hypothetical protein BV87_16140 [Sphingobium yanoikuyae]KMW31968.1 hypothetical protein BV87_20970 [Sphingobium yanoikuyae]